MIQTTPAKATVNLRILLGQTVTDVYPDAVITPSLMITSTDSKYFSGLSKNIYKFMPVLFCEDDLPRFHGVNERIGIKNYNRAIKFKRNSKGAGT